MGLVDQSIRHRTQFWMNIDNLFQSPKHKIEVCRERLSFYYKKLKEHYANQSEDWHMFNYIEERVSFWKAELNNANQDEYFKHLNEKFNIE